MIFLGLTCLPMLQSWNMFKNSLKTSATFNPNKVFIFLTLAFWNHTHLKKIHLLYPTQRVEFIQFLFSELRPFLT